MYSKIFLLLIISISVSEGLFSEPDLSDPSLPLRTRQMCGFRFRPYKQKISYKKKCFMHSFKDRMAFNPIFNSYPNKSQPKDRVLLGVPTEYREAPWTVQLALSFEFDGLVTHYYFCTGVLITNMHILTAAHCYHPSLSIFMGWDWNLDGYRYDSTDFKFIAHPQYNVTEANGNHTITLENDIAFIVMNRPLDFRFFDLPEVNEGMNFRLNTICLPLPEEFINYEYENATFFGWGSVEGDQEPQWLQKADVEVRYHNKTYFNSRPYTYPRSCKGDSGSGLVQYLDNERTRAVLIGITGGSVYPDANTTRECQQDRSMYSYFIRVVNHLDFIYNRIKQDIYIEDILDN